MNDNGGGLAPRDYHAIITKVANLKDVDLDKLKQLMDMQEEWERRRAAEHFNEAMAEAQGEMSAVSRDSVNPQTRSKYASLAALDDAIRPIYTKHGFSISFDEENASDTHVLLFAFVSCGPETRRFKKWVPVNTKGFQGREMMTLTHASIGAITYGRRTLLKMIFNLAEEDDDGNLAGGKSNGSVGPSSYAQPTRERNEPPTDPVTGQRI